MTQPDRSNKYQRLADQCLRDVEPATSEPLRRELLERAQAYLRLARGEVYICDNDEKAGGQRKD